jgi:DASH complex subunit ASK1
MIRILTALEQFWKQFFEASANVSLSGYEELANDDDGTTLEESTVQDTTVDYTSHVEEDVTANTPIAQQQTYQINDSMLDDDDLTGSTPRPPATKTIMPQFSNLQSPYENLKRELRGDGQTTDIEGESSAMLDEEEDSTVLFQQRTARLPDMSMTPRSLLPTASGSEQSPQRNKNPLLHRVLDKNYRLQATPHKTGLKVSPFKGKIEKENKPIWQDSPMSSPEMAVPTLRSELYMSPVRQRGRQPGPRTPGVSVQTPGTGNKTRDVFEDSTIERKPSGKEKYEINWESDSDEESGGLYGGMSPPKTIQFALPPSKLLQTPGKRCPVKETCVCFSFIRHYFIFWE